MHKNKLLLDLIFFKVRLKYVVISILKSLTDKYIQTTKRCQGKAELEKLAVTPEKNKISRNAQESI